MSFRDHWVTDSSGKKFIFTVEMQRRLEEAGLPVEPDSLSELENMAGRPAAQPQRPQQEQRPRQEQRSQQESDDWSPPSQQEQDDFGPEMITIDPQTGKYLGQLKWFNPVRGYGFIARGGGEDIFFHKTSIVGNPDDFNEGLWVLYDVEERRKGLEAAEVEIYEGEPVA